MTVESEKLQDCAACSKERKTMKFGKSSKLQDAAPKESSVLTVNKKLDQSIESRKVSDVSDNNKSKVVVSYAGDAEKETENPNSKEMMLMILEEHQKKQNKDKDDKKLVESMKKLKKGRKMKKRHSSLTTSYLIHINVYTMGFVLEFNSLDYTIEDVKERINKRLDIKPEEQKLTFYHNGYKELQRSTTLREVVQEYNRFGFQLELRHQKLAYSNFLFRMNKTDPPIEIKMHKLKTVFD